MYSPGPVNGGGYHAFRQPTLLLPCVGAALRHLPVRGIPLLPGRMRFALLLPCLAAASEAVSSCLAKLRNFVGNSTASRQTRLPRSSRAARERRPSPFARTAVSFPGPNTLLCRRCRCTPTVRGPGKSQVQFRISFMTFPSRRVFPVPLRPIRYQTPRGRQPQWPTSSPDSLPPTVASSAMQAWTASSICVRSSSNR